MPTAGWRAICSGVSASRSSCVGVSLILLALMRLAPGGPEAVLVGDFSQDVADQVRHRLGLDRPLLAQYASWVLTALRGDRGRSFKIGPRPPRQRHHTPRGGRGPGADVPLLHGGPGTESSGLVRSVGPLAPARGLRLIFYDHRGHGRSERVAVGAVHPGTSSWPTSRAFAEPSASARSTSSASPGVGFSA